MSGLLFFTWKRTQCCAPTAFWWFPYKNVETSLKMNFMHELCSKVRCSKGSQCFIHFLYPKKGASSLQDFRPIKSTRKILAKMLASRLCELLSIIISQEARCFLFMDDNFQIVLIVHKCIDTGYKRQRFGLAHQLGFEKPMTFNWHFWTIVFIQIGFGRKRRDWVKRVYSLCAS